MKKILLAIVLILICLIMVVSAAMIYDHHKSAYEKVKDKKYKSTENERVTIYSEVESETSSVSTTAVNGQLVLKEISGGYVDINTNEFYPSQYVRELNSKRALVNGEKVKITN